MVVVVVVTTGISRKLVLLNLVLASSERVVALVTAPFADANWFARPTILRVSF